MKSSLRLLLSVGLALSLVGGSVAQAATAERPEALHPVAGAVESAAHGLLETTEALTVGADADSALLVGTVDVPRNLDDHIVVSDDVRIAVPGAEAAQSATPVANSVVVYEDTAADVDTVVQAHVGAVGVLTVLNSAAAPTRYDFDLQVPDGGQVTADGAGFVITDASRTPVAAIAAPWASDADGQPVPVSYSLSGLRLTMTVAPSVSAAYPIVADPWVCSWDFCGYIFTRTQTQALKAGLLASGAAGVVAACKRLGVPAWVCSGIAAASVGLLIQVLNEPGCLAITYYGYISTRSCP